MRGHGGRARTAVRRDGDAQPRAVELTHDHSPVVWEERQRIQKAGGTVVEGRVLGQLEVSRALGDGRFKTVGVISTPEASSGDAQSLVGSRDPGRRASDARGRILVTGVAVSRGPFRWPFPLTRSLGPFPWPFSCCPFP